jgi:hypothetical protein
MRDFVRDRELYDLLQRLDAALEAAEDAHTTDHPVPYVITNTLGEAASYLTRLREQHHSAELRGEKAV